MITCEFVERDLPGAFVPGARQTMKKPFTVSQPTKTFSINQLISESDQLERHTTMNSKQLEQQYPLHVAAGRGLLNVVKHLVEVKKVDVNTVAPERMNWTPLHYATYYNKPEIVSYLLAHQARRDLTNVCLLALACSCYIAHSISRCSFVQ